jgi:ATP-dependent DNA helicase DinG
MSSSSATSRPEAVIKLKQGFGRLDPAEGRHGQVAILDPWVRSKPHGRQLLDGLPDCMLVIDDGDTD